MPCSQLWMKILYINIPLASSTFTNFDDLILPTKVLALLWIYSTDVRINTHLLTHTTKLHYDDDVFYRRCLFQQQQQQWRYFHGYWTCWLNFRLIFILKVLTLRYFRQTVRTCEEINWEQFFSARQLLQKNRKKKRTRRRRRRRE